MTRPRRVLLIGMMGAGKSTTAALVADALGWPWFDSDAEVERRCGRSVAELWAAEGEETFRKEEAAVVGELLSGPLPAVVALGGGAVLDPDSATAIGEGGTVVWLRAHPAALAGRIGDDRKRPLVEGRDRESALAELSTQREGVYASLAHAVIKVDDLTPEEVAAAVLAALQDA